MIGLALILFYTLLISITEHSSFSLAYAISSCAVIGLISWYSLAILKTKKFPLSYWISPFSAVFVYLCYHPIGRLCSFSWQYWFV